MSPAEIQALIRNAVADGIGYPWWIPALAIVGAALGAYLASYLAKKGESRAARENFEILRTQLQTTTRDTEEIKKILSGEIWRDQRHWTAREQYYSNLLTQLHLFRIALDNLSEYYLEPGSEHTPDHKQSERFRTLLASGYEARCEVQRLLGPAALFLSRTAVQALNEFEVQHWDLQNFGSSCTADYVHSAQELATKAYEQVLQEARKHLGIAEAHG
ncbi:MAG TPA: hypothetical protein VK149_05005 [Sideroxyarcus sp.]|nr:hypothetical protein [Sideroxyarcus sp.]